MIMVKRGFHFLKVNTIGRQVETSCYIVTICLCFLVQSLNVIHHLNQLSFKIIFNCRFSSVPFSRNLRPFSSSSGRASCIWPWQMRFCHGHTWPRTGPVRMERLRQEGHSPFPSLGSHSCPEPGPPGGRPCCLKLFGQVCWLFQWPVAEVSGQGQFEPCAADGVE